MLTNVILTGLWGCLLTTQVEPLNRDSDRSRSLTYDPAKREWVESPPPTPGTPEGDLYVIQEKIKAKKHRRALRSLKKYVRTYGERHQSYPEVLITKARARMGLEDYDEAHDLLQSFLSEFGGMRLTADALRLEFVIAEAYLKGAKRKLWGFRILSGEDTAYRILDEISFDYADYRIAELAIKTKADYFFAKGDHSLAELEYARMVKEYPTSRYHQYALRRSADSALASHSGIDYDDAALIEAEERYREYRTQYPSSADAEGVGLILSGIREQRAEKAFITGEYYERTEHVASAIFYYQWVARDWTGTVAASKARSRLELLGAPIVVASTFEAASPRALGSLRTGQETHGIN